MAHGHARAGSARGARHGWAVVRSVALALLLTGGVAVHAGADGPGGAGPRDAAVATPTGLQDQRSASVTWTGGRSTHKEARAYGGSFVALSGRASATFSFRGAGAAWLARTGPFDGRADVYVDGRRTSRVDLYTPTKRYQQVVYRVTGLGAGTHTVRVVRTGRKDHRSVGRNVTVDAFQVLDDRPPAPPRDVGAGVAGTSATIRWAAPEDGDVAGYRVVRTSGEDRDGVLVGTTGPDGRTLLDAGLPAGVEHTFRVQAFDTSGNAGGWSVAGPVTVPEPGPDRTPRSAGCPPATVTVSGPEDLAAALAAAGPGTVVRLLPGTYPDQVKVSVRGTPDAPVWLCGPRTAVVDGGGVTRNGGIRVAGSEHLVVAGLSVRSSQKGVSVLGSSDVVLADLTITDIGQEAVHLKQGTTGSTVIGNVIDRTGLQTPQYGEGVYVGTDSSAWCATTGCAPDRSDGNRVVQNTISRTAAEPVEVKEGTSGGVVAGNRIDGTGSAAGRLVALKGSAWTVSGNQGGGSALDGVQVLRRAGYGEDNVVVGNTFEGPLPGFGVRVPTDDTTTVVGCDNRVPARARGVTNVRCQP